MATFFYIFQAIYFEVTYEIRTRVEQAYVALNSENSNENPVTKIPLEGFWIRCRVGDCLNCDPMTLNWYISKNDNVNVRSV